MADGKAADPLVSMEKEVEVDAETAAAIERGIRAADEGRVVPAEKVRKLIPQWISKLSTRNRRSTTLKRS
jgi:predicted transcriptional regulator